jgi:hypothetical protein
MAGWILRGGVAGGHVVALISEYALTPDVFDETCYGSAEVCGVHLQGLKEILLHEALVRDLRDGEWARLFLGDQRPWHRRGKELLKKLASQRRLLASAPAITATPATDAEWCAEAIASHGVRALTGVIVSDTLGPAHRGNALVTPISNLAGAAWWAGRSPTIRLGRTLAEYRSALELVVRHANSMMVIDPYIDPADRSFQAIVTVLEGAAGRAPKPLIEIHRVAWLDGQDKRPQNAALEGSMRAGLQPAATRSGLSFEVFLWDHFHDRYLISDLVGILVPHGFKTTTAPAALTTWSRLGRPQRDDVQREFDPASERHRLWHRFTVG